MDRPSIEGLELAPPGGAKVVVWLTVLGTLAWLGAILLAPYLAARGLGGPAAVLYAAFSPVCHQRPERSFSLFGHPLAVCGRCLGIYSGFAAGLALALIIRRPWRMALPPGPWALLVAALPMAIEAGGEIVGLWAGSNALRLATGVAWGAVLPFYVLQGLHDLAAMRQERKAARGPCEEGPEVIEYGPSDKEAS